ncbi:MAG: PAS domain S-box protein [Ardenticatenaceae bacterium]|nr:PAS domain S-box protein [Ardenticatenaceae bacterium]
MIQEARRGGEGVGDHTSQTVPGEVDVAFRRDMPPDQRPDVPQVGRQLLRHLLARRFQVIAALAIELCPGDQDQVVIFPNPGMQRLHRRSDGTPFPVEVYGTTFTYKGRRHVLQMVRDITKRVQTEEWLREKEEQYRSVFEATSDGVFINTLEGELVDFNPAAAQMHGYTDEEFRALQPADFIHPDSQPLFHNYSETVRGGRSYRCRAIDRRKDGSLFHVEVIGQPFSYGGQPHTLAVVRDVTEEVEAYQLLEGRVAE